MPDSMDATSNISSRLTKVLHIPEVEARKTGFTADGVIVRAASILGANKFYETVPGFVYRIHGANKFASLSKLAQLYLRQNSKKLFFKTITDHFNIEHPPRIEELREEFESRQYVLRRRRRIRIRIGYLVAILGSQGSLAQKIAGIYALIMSQKSSV